MSPRSPRTPSSAPTTPSAPDDDLPALRARLDALEAENARLTRTAPRPDGGRWRAVVSALCIVVAVALTPASIVAAWARVEIVDTDSFVETFGPLAEDPDVQALVADQVTAAIEEQLDIGGLTDDLFDGIATLGLPQSALDALELLRVPAAEGARGLIDQTVTALVESEAFAEVWRGALRASHGAFQLAATGGSDTVTVTADGTVGIELGPIVEQARELLLAQGIELAAAIPEVDRSIELVQSDALVTVQVVYAVADLTGWWLPVLALLLFVAGVLVARRRSTALLGAGVGLALGAGVLVVALGAAGTAFALAAPGIGVPADALGAIYAQVISDMRQTSIVLLVVGVLIALLAWSQGRWRTAAALRAGVGAATSGLRGLAAARGVDTGRFGSWMDRYRMLVRAVIAVGAIGWMLALRPLGVGEVVLVVVVALILWWLAELVRRPGASVSPAPAPAAPGGA